MAGNDVRRFGPHIDPAADYAQRTAFPVSQCLRPIVTTGPFSTMAAHGECFALSVGVANRRPVEQFMVTSARSIR